MEMVNKRVRESDLEEVRERQIQKISPKIQHLETTMYLKTSV